MEKLQFFSIFMGRAICVWIDELPGVGIVTHKRHASVITLLVVGH